MDATGKNRGKRLAVIGLRGFPGIQGGVETHCAQLMPRLADEFSVRVYRRRPYLNATALAGVPGIDFKDLPSTRLKGLEPVIHTFLSCLDLLTHRVDVVNIHNIGPGLFAPLLRLGGMKVVLTYHSPNYEHAKWGRFAKMVLKFSEKVALTFSNRIIFVSPFQRQKYSEKIQRKSETIPNGIPAHGITEKTDFLEKHGLRKGQYALAVGRLTPEKGFDTLIRAVNANPEINRLVIAGDADQESDYKNMLRNLNTDGKVTFTGYTTGDDLVQLYQNAGLYVLSSVNEGFPMVLLEAMSYGLPIVATDIPAARLIPLPETHYCKPGDIASMSRAMSRVMADSGQTEYDLSKYDWDTIARNTAAIYNQV